MKKTCSESVAKIEHGSRTDEDESNFITGKSAEKFSTMESVDASQSSGKEVEASDCVRDVVFDKLKEFQHYKLFQPRHCGDAADSLVAEFDKNFCADRQIDVNPRAEFNESDMFIKVNFFVLLCISDYAPCNCAGNLAHKDFRSAFGADNNG